MHARNGSGSGIRTTGASSSARYVWHIHANVVHPYVKGVDGNALYDFYWSDARILQHS